MDSTHKVLVMQSFDVFFAFSLSKLFENDNHEDNDNDNENNFIAM